MLLTGSRSALAVALILVLGTPVPALADDAAQRFTSGIDLVLLDVCVKDTAGRFIPSLDSADFLVVENGRPQDVSFLSAAGTVPLTVVLLIDRSASMAGGKLERAVEAATRFSGLLGPQDELEILTFNHRTERVFAFGDHRTGVIPALESIEAIGATGLYDALLVAANDLGRIRRTRPDAREVVLVLSDGEDTASLIGFEEVLASLRRSGALVYSVSLRAGARGEWLGANWPLLQFARDTGGRALGVPQLDALPALYGEIGEEVRHLYRIGYVSKDERRDGQWRTISVHVPAYRARVRARAGYYAPKGAPGKER